MTRSSFFTELRRRNVFRAAAFYIAAVWALAQGISQLGPAVGAPEWTTRWFLVAAAIGFPFWLAFAWFYEFTPEGLKRESEIDPAQSITARTGKKLDRWIIAILGVAVVLLLTDRFTLHKNGDTAISDKSIAVLPLANASGDKDQQYFSDGLSENLIIALSQLSGLKVIGRSSAFQFRDTKDDAKTIGMKLGVARLLEGSVQRAGDAVRIGAELIDAADGSTLWSQRYDRPYKDLFALQDEITKAVASALSTKLLPNDSPQKQSDRPPGGNLEAYTAYLQGQFYGARNTEADRRKAIEQFTTAIRLDPRYALAWAWLSYSWTALAAEFLEGAAAQKAYVEARGAIDTSLKLDPDLAIAHAYRGQLLLNADFDRRGAEAEFRRAVQLAPDDGSTKFYLGTLLATLGRPDQAVEFARQALATDPLRASGYGFLAIYLSALDRLDEARLAINKGIELQPAAAFYHTQLTIIEILRGDAGAALAAAQAEPPGVWHDEALALALQIGSDRAAAAAALQTLIEKAATQGPYQIAQVHALRKDADKTFEWLDRAWAARDSGIQLLLYDPLILRFRDDPRFAAFCAKVGLPTTTTAKAMREQVRP